MTTVKNEVSALVKSLVEADADVKTADKKLKEAKERSRYLREESIPTMMQEQGLESLVLDTGQKLTIKKELYASIKEENKIKALGWLQEHGLGSIIKSTVKVEFNRTEIVQAGKLAEELIRRNMDPEFKEYVHPTTLKATLKIEIANGKPVPLDLFSARPVLVAKIK